MAAAAERGAKKPITVIHFPKVGKPVAVPRRTQTLPADTAFAQEDPVTEPESYQLIEEQRQAAAVARAAKRPKGRRKTAELPAQDGQAPATREPELTPRQAGDLATMGHQLFELGRVQEARAVFERLIASKPRDAYAHTMLGTIFLALGDQDRALALFQAALELDPHDIAARVYRGEVRLGRGKVRPAMEDLERAMQLGPADDPFVERAGRLLKMARAAFRKLKR